MLVEASPTILDATRRELESLGCIVITHDTPLGVAIVAGNEKPDCVLVDAHMASMSGEQVVKGLKTRAHLPNETRVLLFSDRNERELRDAAERCGADGYIKTTTDRTALRNALKVGIGA